MLTALRAGHYHVVISDYRLPEFSGPDALAVLKESGVDLPFIIVSGTVGEVNAVEAMKAGAHDYVMKDNLMRLVPAIGRELHEAQLRRDRRRTEMALLVNQPELFNMFGAIDAFDVDPANAKIALTTGQGAFEPPLKNGADNPARHIRLGLGFFAPTVTPDFAAFILIHELSHFTGRRDGERIEDNGRGWFDDTFIRPLSAAKRLLNADSYASFAQECRTGSSAKPPFVRTAPGGLGGAR